MSRLYTVDRRFHIGYSIIGRFIKDRIKDTHYAEGIFILTFAVLFIGLVLANYLGWALLHPFFTTSAGDSNAFLYWIGQMCGGLLFLALCVVGFKPAVHVSFDKSLGLSIEQGQSRLHLPLQEITAVTSISALRFHRHHRKYRATRSFFVRLPQSLILISTTGSPVVLGLDKKEHQELLSLLQPQTSKIVFSALSPTV